MSVPKHRRTRASKKRRASHFGLKKQQLSECGKCGEATKPHHACLNCGFYNGKQVVDTARKQTRVIEKATTNNASKE